MNVRKEYNDRSNTPLREGCRDIYEVVDLGGGRRGGMLTVPQIDPYPVKVYTTLHAGPFAPSNPGCSCGMADLGAPGHDPFPGGDYES